MAKNVQATANIKTVDSPVPVGGNPAKVDSPILEPDEISWNDGGAQSTASVGTDVAVVNDAGTSRDQVTPEVKAKIDALLGRGPAPDGVALTADGSPSVLQPGDTPTRKDAATVTGDSKAATGKALRRDLLTSARAERTKIEAEAAAKSERARADAAEAMLKTGKIADIAKLRGMTEEQVLEEFVRNPGTEPAAVDPIADIKTEVKGIKDSLAAREARVTAQENAQNEIKVTNFITDQIKDLDVPLVKATKAWPVQDDAGNFQMHSGVSLVRQAAEKLWKEGGSVKGDQAKYIKMAALAAEDILDSDTKATVDAAIAKRGGARTVATPAADPKSDPKPRPSVGKGGGGGGQRDPKTVSGDGLPTDPTERRAEIKRRFPSLP